MKQPLFFLFLVLSIFLVTANAIGACPGDRDGDGDRDGVDLSLYITAGDFSGLADFVSDYGTICPSSIGIFALNDTGVTTCSDGTTNGLDCASTADGTDSFPGQDAEQGRDVTANDDSDGLAGFVFSKLDSAGNPLSDQTADYSVTPWSCVQDEVTGLLWEVKTDDDGLQDKDWTYSWYNTSGINDGGDIGVGNGGQCVDDSNCDTEKFVAAVNAAGLCGFDDWRVPERRELLSLVHFGATSAPYIDTSYFVHTAQLPYWTSSPAPLGNNVAFVNFSEYGSRNASRDQTFAVRLVRGGQ